MKTTHNPLRAVTSSRLRYGVGGLLSSQRYDIRWWELTLECGHKAERPAKAKPGAAQGRRGFRLMLHPVRDEDLQGPPKKARCSACRKAGR